MEKFNAYRIFEENGKSRGRVVALTLDELDPGEVVIKVAYSSVNFKDALAGTGAAKIVRRYPCVGGIDSSGTVVSSSDGRFKAGDPVICTSYDFAMAHDGGYASYARVPAEWVVDDVQGAVDRILRFADPARRAEAAAQARRMVLDRYDWAACTARYDKLILR